MPRITLLGIHIDSLTMEEAVGQMLQFLNEDSCHHVVTPNSEMLVKATRNHHFRSVLNAASLALPDSAGLLWAAKWTGQKLHERVAGVDAVQHLAERLHGHHGVFFLGAGHGIAEQAAAALHKRNPHLKIAGTFSGSPSPKDAPEILRRIKEAKPSILLVAYGAPAQDLWIARHLHELHGVRIAMGVGGTFDFLAGKAKRAPGIFHDLHLEWAWRLMMEPWRVRRILRAVFVFPLKVLLFGKKEVSKTAR